MSEYGFQQPKRRKGEFLYILLLNARESVPLFRNDNKIKQKNKLLKTNSRCFLLSTGAVGNVLIGVSVSFYARSIGPLGPNEIHWLKNAITIGIFYIVIFLNPYLLK